MCVFLVAQQYQGWSWSDHGSLRLNKSWILMRRCLSLKKYLRIYSFLYKLKSIILNQDSIIDNLIYKKRPMIEDLWFHSKAFRFYGWTVVFVKFNGLPMFCCHLLCFLQSNNLVSPIKEPIFFQEIQLNLDIVFSCYLMSLMNVNSFVFKKTSLNFWTFELIYLTYLNFRRILSKNRKNPFPPSCVLLFLRFYN